MKKLFAFWLLISTPALFATTRYVAKTGSDSNTCAQSTSTSTPKLTLASGLACMAGSDTLIINDVSPQIYTEFIDNQIPSGSSGNPTIVKAATFGNVTLKPSAVSTSGDAITIRGFSWITLQNLIVDGTNVPASAAHGIRIAGVGGNIVVDGCEVTHLNDASGQGILVQDITTTPVTLKNNIVADVGGTSTLLHGIYVRSPGNLIEKNTIHDIGGYGVHIYFSGHTDVINNIIRKNNIYNWRRNTTQPSAAILLSSGTGNKAYNNIMYRPSGGTGHSCIQIDYGGNSSEIYNNTCWNPTTYGFAIGRNSTISGVIVKNNIVYQSGTTDISNSGTGTVLANNQTTNPQFVDSANADFHLTAGNSAIGGGVSLSSIFTDDYAGTSRPQGTNWDIGAYEYISPPASLTMLSPNGGENIKVGTAQTVLWSSNGAGATVDIDLDPGNDGIYEVSIVSGATNNGSYAYTVPNNPSATCKMRVKDHAAATNDASNAVFTIAASVTPSITVTSPTTGNIASPAASVPVTWTSVGITGNVKIELSRDGGTTYPETLSASFPFSGSDYQMIVPLGASTSTAKVKVTSLNDTTVFGESNAFRLAGMYLTFK